MRSELARKAFRLGYHYTFLVLLMEVMLLVVKCPEMTWLAMLVLLGLFLAFYFLREHVRRIWPLFLLCIACGVGIWFLQEIMLQKLLLIAVDIGLLVTSSRYVMSGGKLPEPMDIPWPGILLGILSTISGVYYDIHVLVVYSVILTVANIFFFLLVLYADGLGKYAQATRDVKGMPISRMLKINNLIILGIFLLMLITIGLGELLGIPNAVGEFLDMLGGLMKSLFYGVVLLYKWLVRLLGSGNAESIEETEEALAAEMAKRNVGSGFIFVILRFITLLVLLFLAFRFLIWLFKILAAKYHKSEREVVTETTRPDVRERLKDRDLRSRIRKYVSMEERARRIYRKRVLEAAKETELRQNDTTGDIREILKLHTDTDLSELTELYEAVRYGSVTVDREYLLRMKKAGKQEKR